MAALLAASMAVVVTYCLARVLVPSLHDPGHRRDLDAWHVVMGGAMAAMLLVTYTRLAAVLALVVFAVGLGWSVRRIASPGARSAYLRLGVGCAAMAAMLLPTATASAAMPAAPGHAAHHAHAAPPGATALVPPTVLVAALLAACGVILVVRLAGTVRGDGSLAGRLAACCDVAMATAMGYMLVALL